ncbi:MAG: InlB B-repeat-containing protein, partial [Bacteroidales bacterium]|nr:InlB B-repeat-containing protein [Bacteroidales bacterium]
VSISDPNVEGYEFKGWNPVIPSTMPGQNVLVIADMQILQYNFITKVDDDSDTILYNFNEAIVAPEAPTKEGHTFKGWSSAIPATMPAEDVIISALWETNSYKVYFVSDEDTLQTLSYKYGAKIERPKSPSKEGYLFLDWLDEMGGEIPATMPAKDLVFNAEWADILGRELSSVMSRRNCTLPGCISICCIKDSTKFSSICCKGTLICNFPIA